MAGGKLKESSYTHWQSPNTGATNETGFTAIPGGRHFSSGHYGFLDIAQYGYWWSSTEYQTMYTGFLIMGYDGSAVGRSQHDKTNGYSVRCLKD